MAVVFVVGTTGALVSATVSNGVTTVTVTEPSPTTVTETTETEDEDQDEDSSVSSSLDAAENCSEQAHAAAEAVQTVNRAFSGFHTDLVKLRKGADEDGRELVKDADDELKFIRQVTVQAIHEATECDEDEELDEDAEESDEDTEDEESDEDVETSDSDYVVTGDTPEAMAENAVAAMEEVFNAAKAELEATTTVSETRSTGSDHSKAKNKSSSHGSGHDDDEDDEDDDD